MAPRSSYYWAPTMAIHEPSGFFAPMDHFGTPVRTSFPPVSPTWAPMSPDSAPMSPFFSPGRQSDSPTNYGSAPRSPSFTPESPRNQPESPRYLPNGADPPARSPSFSPETPTHIDVQRPPALRVLDLLPPPGPIPRRALNLLPPPLPIALPPRALTASTFIRRIRPETPLEPTPPPSPSPLPRLPPVIIDPRIHDLIHQLIDLSDRITYAAPNEDTPLHKTVLDDITTELAVTLHHKNPRQFGEQADASGAKVGQRLAAAKNRRENHANRVQRVKVRDRRVETAGAESATSAGANQVYVPGSWMALMINPS